VSMTWPDALLIVQKNTATFTSNRIPLFFISVQSPAIRM
jgi:hypothetical protein